MPTVMKEVDIVFVGFGFGSSMVAKELVSTGLKMVGLERGFPRFTSPDFNLQKSMTNCGSRSARR